MFLYSGVFVALARTCAKAAFFISAALGAFSAELPAMLPKILLPSFAAVMARRGFIVLFDYSATPVPQKEVGTTHLLVMPLRFLQKTQRATALGGAIWFAACWVDSEGDGGVAAGFSVFRKAGCRSLPGVSLSRRG